MKNLFFLLLVLLVVIRSFCQQTTYTINYAGTLNIAEKCNVLGIVPTIDGIIHYPASGGILADTKSLRMPTNYNSSTKIYYVTAYLIAFNFKQNYTYNITVNANIILCSAINVDFVQI